VGQDAGDAGDAAAPDAAPDAANRDAEAESPPEPDAGADAPPSDASADGDLVVRDDGGIAETGAPVETIRRMAVGGGHVCAIRSNGSLWCRGAGYGGQLGDGTMPVGRAAPGPVPALGNAVIAAAGGPGHTMAVTADRSLWLWGNNLVHQLGDGTKVNRYVPWQSPSFAGVAVSASAGHDATCALKTDGTVWCWGENFYGQLGDGTSMPRSTPVQVKGLADVTQLAVSVASQSACARKIDGSVWCWGATLARTEFTDFQTTPVRVLAIGNSAAQVAVSGNACVRKLDGTLWCWGSNFAGYLGDGTETRRPTPVQITSVGNTVADVGVGPNHTCVLKLDNSVWCWGHNLQGQLGNGTDVKSLTAVEVTALGHSVVEIAVGDSLTCARKTDESIWCWGSGADGVFIDNEPVAAIRLPIEVPFPK
jgi:alpha-tubulin suppressor-like RCC1 family protein